MTSGPITYAELAEKPLTELGGLRSKPKKIDALHELGIETVLDLLTTYPRRYIDRTHQASIRDLRPGMEAMVIARVVRIASRRTRGRPARTLVTADVTDDAGHLRITFFNQGWRERQLPAGTEAVFFGKVDTYQGRMQMTSPLVDLIGDKTARIVALYPQSEKLRITTIDMDGWVESALSKCRARGLAEPVPEPVLDRFDFVDRTRAMWGIHAPSSMAEMAEARRRLVFDELLRLQLALVLRKRALERTATGIRHDISGRLVASFQARLPFPLTAAQQRTIGEITDDLASVHPMHRLLQGDVGSGKTVVAVSALLTAVQGGHQGALMAPTEVLAEQHYSGISQLLEGFEVPANDDEGSLFAGQGMDRSLRIELLTNRTTPTNRRKLAEALHRGDVDILVGTHALIEETVAFRSLGAIVIDEQHRFGVEQRAALRQKGADGATPDVLVMTATPIPRTAAMTVYGDLDVSVLDEMPPGRRPITTRWVRTAAPDEAANALPLHEVEDVVWSKVRAEVADGRQAYVVCPLIEESDKLEVRSAEETFERLRNAELAGLRLGLLHGRMSSAQKEATMAEFRARSLDVLVSTTVIEVGVDVANATVMAILDADRFGIAQLHQLRGRVGRGGDASWCFLVGAGSTPDGARRLEAMVASSDGFELAEIDLDLRGEGTIMGERQKGRNDLKLASLRRDREWVAKAREVAFELIDADPGLGEHPLLAAEVFVFQGDDEADFLLKS
ncbi:MAG: ATP-dependent DNA helicase RecG [Actinomycetota bacterium]|nr:ATP-dependent DNA helicase RecG [Actinomycetota bacterium]